MLNRYKLATTWLQGVPVLVPACVLNLALKVKRSVSIAMQFSI